jgi:hypothetical protein
VLGRSYRLFSVAGTLGISGMMLVLFISVAHNTWRLYRREPLPQRAAPASGRRAAVTENLAAEQ